MNITVSGEDCTSRREKKHAHGSRKSTGKKKFQFGNTTTKRAGNSTAVDGKKRLER